MKYLEQIKARIPKKFKTLTVVIIAVVGVLVLAGIATLVVKAFNSQDWSLGAGTQRSADEIARVQTAVEAVENDAIIDVHVENANTSGQPLGHSIRVNILLDSERFNSNGAATVDTLASDVEAALRESGVKDTYTILMGLNVAEGAISGRGTPENPVTSAKSMTGSETVYLEEYEVR